jgi:hypothetical protein
MHEIYDESKTKQGDSFIIFIYDIDYEENIGEDEL